jgi:hypothetical protein
MFYVIGCKNELGQESVKENGIFLKDFVLKMYSNR